MLESVEDVFWNTAVAPGLTVEISPSLTEPMGLLPTGCFDSDHRENTRTVNIGDWQKRQGVETHEKPVLATVGESESELATTISSAL